jgi:hypothetical protein
MIQTIRFSAQPEPQPQLQRTPPSRGGGRVALMEPPERPQPAPQAPEPRRSSMFGRLLLMAIGAFGFFSIDKTGPNEQAVVRYPLKDEPVVVQPNTRFFNPPFLASVQRTELPKQ